MAAKKDLTDQGELHAVVTEVIATAFASPVATAWFADASRFLENVRAGLPGRLRDSDFLKTLFESTTLAATGMGSVPIDQVIEDAQFRARFADMVGDALALPVEQRAAHVKLVYDETVAAFDAARGRRPLLKLNRALAALFPEAFTTIAALAKLQSLHQRLGGSVNDHPVDMHRQVRTKLDAAALSVRPEMSQPELLCFPWYVFDYIRRETEPDSPQGKPADPRASGIVPKSASLRRKGLTALRGYFSTLLRFVDELRDGLTREELAAVIKDELPNYSDSSIQAVVGQLRGQFGVCYADGDRLRLTPLGLSLLDDSGDLEEFGGYLLTRVFGVDHLVKALEAGPLSRDEVYRRLRLANRNWTSNFAPSSLHQWLVSLGVVQVGRDGTLSLTERGKNWARWVTWDPEPLTEVEEQGNGPTLPPVPELRLPGFDELLSAVRQISTSRGLRFKDTEVTGLHSALWFHRRRQFVVMAGLSGTGKTQLARAYADGLCGASDRVLIQPVEPGWFDSSDLLGFVDPVRSIYRSTRFVSFLADAANDPRNPYVVILDEMNLSHPEQYMAPLLSAMETGDVIALHSLDETVAADIPRQLVYPSNLAIIGTVNMDETTHGLSDKLLDRAYTLEFWDVPVAEYPGWQSAPLTEDLKQRICRLLENLGQALAPARMHFGWRTIGDVIQFIAFNAKGGLSTEDALDAVIYAKVLPKLRGDSSPAFSDALSKSLEVLQTDGLERSANKVSQLKADLAATGTARFWR